MAATSDNLWQAFKTLFGDNPTREQSQQFSTSQVADQAIAQNSAGTQAKLADLNIQKDAASSGTGLNAQGYQSKAAIDYNQAANLKSLNQGGGAISGYSDFFNNYTPIIKGSPYNPRIESIQRQNPVAVQMAYQNRLQNENADADVQRKQALADSDRYNQALLSQQNSVQQLNSQFGQLDAQKQIAKTQADAQKQVAAIQAQGNVISSLFGAFSQRQDHKYWN